MTIPTTMGPHLGPQRRPYGARPPRVCPVHRRAGRAVYQEAERHAEQLRADERRRIKEAKKNFVDMGTRWRGGAARRLSRHGPARGGVRGDCRLFKSRIKGFGDHRN